ncbi:MAG TPA: SRPBCC family protein [Magnetospirillaceae bacterium]|jgi:carbon monoxide dehydrogenase subunit G
MASVIRDIVIAVSADRVWGAIRDLEGLHRLVPGLVATTTIEPASEATGPAIRVVTFTSGLILRERIVDVDDKARRIAVTATGGRIAHHNSWMQVLAESETTSRVTWGCDFLPDLLTDTVRGIAERVLAEMKVNLESGG